MPNSNKRAPMLGLFRATPPPKDPDWKKCFVCGEKATKIVKTSALVKSDGVLEFSRCDWHATELKTAIERADPDVKVEILKR